ncbi:hypothetical protein GCM10027046_34800 [Uliginosibacterium flavum]|uniref:Type II secretion system protein n=1 Tax=Uliginosibacterium flavum TaxID=1396831 RepID=A0ABV2TPQ9_9RHOO
MRKGISGLPLYEVALLIVLAGCILGMLGWRTVYLLEQAERTAVNTVITNLRSMLRLEKARRIIAGESLSSLANTNPVALLQSPPVGYCENISSEGSRKPPECPWFYMDEEHVLYYAPQRHAHLQVEAGPHVVLLGWQLVANPVAGKDVELLSIKPYQWF